MRCLFASSLRLADLSGGLPTDSNIQASDIPGMQVVCLCARRPHDYITDRSIFDAAEMTESEWLHERKREHLRRKREQFDKSRPPGPDVEAWVQGSGKALDVAAMKKMYNNRLESVSGAKPKTVASSADKDTAFRVFNQLPGARKKNDKNDVKVI